METIQDNQLSNREKTLIAMGAAMGGGCRTCADKLHQMAVSLDIPGEEMLKAFLLGLEAKEAAVRTMKQKVASLMGDFSSEKTGELSEKLTSMIRMASFTAANSAPDCLGEFPQASSRGITADQIQLCISSAKMVRKHAMEFSDGDISDKLSCSDTNTRAACCSASGNSQNASACSCG